MTTQLSSPSPSQAKPATGAGPLPAFQAALAVQATEAARYAVLRRLAPCLRHQMVRPLQPIGLIYGVMHHKLAAAQPDLDSIRQEAEKINDFAKAAIDECMHMGGWLAPEPGVLTSLDAGVKECVGLTATMLHFCGFRLFNEVDDLPALVQRDAVRMVLCAALFAITDSLTEPAALTLGAATGTAGSGEVTLSVQIGPTGEGSVDRYDDGCRLLSWADVQALASSAQVKLDWQGQLVTMRFAIEPAGS